MISTAQLKESHTALWSHWPNKMSSATVWNGCSLYYKSGCLRFVGRYFQT